MTEFQSVISTVKTDNTSGELVECQRMRTAEIFEFCSAAIAKPLSMTIHVNAPISASINMFSSEIVHVINVNITTSVVLSGWMAKCHVD